MCTRENKFVNIVEEWPKMYSKLCNNEKFITLIKFYYEYFQAGEKDKLPKFENCKTTPIYKEWVFGEDEDVEILKERAKSMSDIYWWILPHECQFMNGFFLYVVFHLLGKSTEIYESKEHTFLMYNGEIVDMYWQPMNYHIIPLNRQVYENSSKVKFSDIIDEYDIQLNPDVKEICAELLS